MLIITWTGFQKEWKDPSEIFEKTSWKKGFENKLFRSLKKKRRKIHQENYINKVTNKRDKHEIFFPQAFRELALEVQRNKGDSRKYFDRYARVILQRVLNVEKKTTGVNFNISNKMNKIFRWVKYHDK